MDKREDRMILDVFLCARTQIDFTRNAVTLNLFFLVCRQMNHAIADSEGK